MKIWMVCETLTEGCAPNVTVLELRNSLKKQGHEVLLLCPTTERKHARPEDPGIHFVPTVKVWGLKYILYQLFLISHMFFLCLKKRPDWIYSRPALAMLSPALVGRLTRIPHLLHLSGDLLEQLKGQNSSALLIGLYAMMERANCRLSRAVIVETPENKTNYQRRHHLSAAKVFAIANGVNTDLFRPMDVEKARREIGMETDSLCVGFVGNLSYREQETVPYLLEAAAIIAERVPKSWFLIVGDGLLKQHLMEMAKRSAASERIVFVGRVPYESVPVYIASMDVCVVPMNKSRFEKTGISSLKVREYLSCGRPVVGSDITGVGDVLRQANAGIALSPENTSELAQAIIGLLQDEDLRKQMGKNGREFAVQHLSWDTTAREILGVYETTVASAKKDDRLHG